MCSSGKQMDPWVRSRVPTSLQPESRGVSGWSHWVAPLECKPLQLWGTFAGREKEAMRKLIHKQGRWGPSQGAVCICDSSPGDPEAYSCCSGHGRGGGGGVGHLAVSPQRQNALSGLFLQIEASAFTVLASVHCAGLFTSYAAPVPTLGPLRDLLL